MRQSAPTRGRATLGPMASRDDWSRCKDWTVDERAVFDQRIARCRQAWTKWQRFDCQANLLFFHGRAADSRSEAVRLLERSLVEVAPLEDAWAVSALTSLAEFTLAMGELERAEAHLRAAAERCPASPKFADLPARIERLSARVRAARG